MQNGLDQQVAHAIDNDGSSRDNIKDNNDHEN